MRNILIRLVLYKLKWDYIVRRIFSRMLLITLLCLFVISHVISIERNLEPVLITKLQYFKLPGETGS